MHLTTQFMSLEILVIKMRQLRAKLLNCTELINFLPGIRFWDKFERHYELIDLTKVKTFVEFHRHVRKILIEITSEPRLHKSFQKTWIDMPELTLPPTKKYTIAATG